MLWQDPAPTPKPVLEQDVVDMAFRIQCPTVPLEHAWALHVSVTGVLPWFADEPRAGLHLIHGAASGNGWMRPEDGADGLLHLSRRARLTLRLPRERTEAATALQGATLDLDGHPVRVGAPSALRPLSVQSTLLARHVVDEIDAGEARFVESTVEALTRLGVEVRKLMCGRESSLRTPDGTLRTRSVLIADLRPADSLAIQREGVGPARGLGCGLFIPHKGIEPVKDSQDG